MIRHGTKQRDHTYTHKTWNKATGPYVICQCFPASQQEVRGGDTLIAPYLVGSRMAWTRKNQHAPFTPVHARQTSKSNGAHTTEMITDAGGRYGVNDLIMIAYPTGYQWCLSKSTYSVIGS